MTVVLRMVAPTVEHLRMRCSLTGRRDGAGANTLTALSSNHRTAGTGVVLESWTWTMSRSHGPDGGQLVEPALGART